MSHFRCVCGFLVRLAGLLHEHRNLVRVMGCRPGCSWRQEGESKRTQFETGCHKGWTFPLRIFPFQLDPKRSGAKEQRGSMKLALHEEVNPAEDGLLMIVCGRKTELISSSNCKAAGKRDSGERLKGKSGSSGWPDED